MSDKPFVKILALLLALLMLVPTVVLADSSMSEQEAADRAEAAASQERAEQEAEREQNKADKMDQVNDLESEYDALEQDLAAIQKEIDKANAQLSNKKNERKKIKEQIAVIQEQLDNLTERITLLEESMAQNEKDIEAAEKDIEVKTAQFEDRLRMSQIQAVGNDWTLLLGAKSLSEFFTAIQTIKRMAEYDTQLINGLKDAKAELKVQREEMEKTRVEVEVLIEDADEKRKDLDSKYTQIQDSIDVINKDLKKTEQTKEELKADMEAIQAEIDDIYSQLEFDENYVGGEFLWPSKTHTKITSTYGWRTWSNGYSDFHTGMDIAGSGIYGTDIVSANAGKVVYVKTTYKAGKGYGKYLIVDHGGGFSTLYAHCSSITVKVGDTVKRGQTIAKVGSTGNSTGPHIHFEIRVDGNHQDPQQWFPNTK